MRVTGQVALRKRGAQRRHEAVLGVLLHLGGREELLGQVALSHVHGQERAHELGRRGVAYALPQRRALVSGEGGVGERRRRGRR